MVNNESFRFRAAREHAVIYFELFCDYTACCAVMASMGQDGWQLTRLNSDGTVFKLSLNNFA
jgi:hypothetical protein